jgi:hypothetical protein
VTHASTTRNVRLWACQSASQFLADGVELGDRAGRQHQVRRGDVLAQVGDRAEIVALSFWDSHEAIEAFGGPDIEQSVLYSEDEKYLLAPSIMTHYDIAPEP